MSQDLSRYVDACLALHGLVLTDDARHAVLEHFERNAAVAAAFLDLPLAPDDEPAPVFRAE